MMDFRRVHAQRAGQRQWSLAGAGARHAGAPSTAAGPPRARRRQGHGARSVRYRTARPEVDGRLSAVVRTTPLFRQGAFVTRQTGRPTARTAWRGASAVKAALPGGACAPALTAALGSALP